jgi:UDP-glucose 4-epimerase
MIDPSPLRGKTALVTGAAGFIGSAVARRLQSAGARVHGVSRARRREGEGGCDRWWQADLTQWAEARRLFDAARPDLVFHLAGFADGARRMDLVLPMLQANLLSVVNLLLAAGNGPVRVLFSGSLEDAPVDRPAVVPASPYAASKIAAGGYARMFQALFGTASVWVRPFMVYGPGERDLRRLVPYVILSLLKREPPALSTGRRLMDWVYIDDVADAFLAAAVAKGVEGQAIDVGWGSPVAVRSVVERLVQMIDPGVGARFGAIPDRPLEQERIADVASTTARTGWSPCVSLEDGLSRTVEWYRRGGFHAEAIARVGAQ